MVLSYTNNISLALLLVEEEVFGTWTPSRDVVEVNPERLSIIVILLVGDILVVVANAGVAV